MEEEYLITSDTLRERLPGDWRKGDTSRDRGLVNLDRESVVADILSKPRALILILELVERPKTVTELCKVIVAGESTIRHYVNTLCNAGLLTRVRGVDGRKKYIKLTLEGKTIANSVLTRFNKWAIEKCGRRQTHGLTNKNEYLIDASCIEELLEQYSREPTKLLRKLGYKEHSWGFLLPPKDTIFPKNNLV